MVIETIKTEILMEKSFSELNEIDANIIYSTNGTKTLLDVLDELIDDKDDDIVLINKVRNKYAFLLSLRL